MTTKKELIERIKVLKKTNKGIKGTLSTMTKEQLQAIIDKFASTEAGPKSPPTPKATTPKEPTPKTPTPSGQKEKDMIMRLLERGIFGPWRDTLKTELEKVGESTNIRVGVSKLNQSNAIKIIEAYKAQQQGAKETVKKDSPLPERKNLSERRKALESAVDTLTKFGRSTTASTIANMSDEQLEKAIEQFKTVAMSIRIPAPSSTNSPKVSAMPNEPQKAGVDRILQKQRERRAAAGPKQMLFANRSTSALDKILEENKKRRAMGGPKQMLYGR